MNKHRKDVERRVDRLHLSHRIQQEGTGELKRNQLGLRGYLNWSDIVGQIKVCGEDRSSRENR
jgi:hypothetical protein